MAWYSSPWVLMICCCCRTNALQIGQTAIEAYLTAFQDADFDPLPLIASAFVSPRYLPMP
jgi:hypothetical protein